MPLTTMTTSAIMNASIWAANNTMDYIIPHLEQPFELFKQMNTMQLFWMSWGISILLGLVAAATSGAEEEVSVAKEPAPTPDAYDWKPVGDHPGFMVPIEVYQRTYDSGKSAYRWRRSPESPWEYGSNPWTFT